MSESVPIPGPKAKRWQDALRDAIRDPLELCRALALPAACRREARRAAGSFPLVVPWEYIHRMRVGDPHDPLLRQVLPLEEELRETPGFAEDPVGEQAAMLRPGLLQKYAQRVLMVATPTCAVHCRYCFRRHFDHEQIPRKLDDWRAALDQLGGDEQIREVVLSGGDPLVLSDQRLGELVARLGEIPHLRRLRVHTRMTVVIPQRVTTQLIELLRTSPLSVIVVIHANHPAEIDAAVMAATARLVDAGIPVLNQSVLLRGVNDEADILAELSERLINMRVMPYYLHQLDRVAGAAHFHVPHERGKQLLDALRKRLPGYAVPRWVEELPGAPHKIPLA